MQNFCRNLHFSVARGTVGVGPTKKWQFFLFYIFFRQSGWGGVNYMPESEGHSGVIVICDHILYLVKKFGAFWSIFLKNVSFA